MTRRQEIAAWLLAVLLALPHVRFALMMANTLEELARPLAIFAPLVIYRLRDRSQPVQPRLFVALAIAVLVALPALLPLVVSQ